MPSNNVCHAQTLMDLGPDLFAMLEDDDGSGQPHWAAHHLLQDQEHLEPEFPDIADVLASCAQLHDARHSLQTICAAPIWIPGVAGRSG